MSQINFSLPVERRRELLDKQLTAHKESAFEIESTIETMKDMKRFDKMEQAQSELAQQRLAIESVNKRMAELK